MLVLWPPYYHSSFQILLVVPEAWAPQEREGRMEAGSIPGILTPVTEKSIVYSPPLLPLCLLTTAPSWSLSEAKAILTSPLYSPLQAGGSPELFGHPSPPG